MKTLVKITIIFLVFSNFLRVTFIVGESVDISGGTGTNPPSSNPFRDLYSFFHDPIYNTLRCGRRGGEEKPPSATIQVIRCAFDILELLKNLALILMAIAFIGAAIYLVSTPFFGLKQIGVAWNILIWTPVGMVIVFLGDLIKDQIERLLLPK